MLPAVEPDLGQHSEGPKGHPVLKELHNRSYEPVGHYTHPEGGTFSVWMKNEERTSRSGRTYKRGPENDGGQVHVDHDQNTGKATGTWHYFHDPETHAANAGWRGGDHNRERFDTHPSEHASLGHPDNEADHSEYHTTKPKNSWSGSRVELANLLDTVDSSREENSAHGGWYQSEHESSLDRAGWRHYETDEHNTHEKYDFIKDPVAKYTNDDKYPDHEIHVHADGRWKHMHPSFSEPVADDSYGDLHHYLKHGIKDTLGASIHDQRDEENDFPDHPTPQYNMSSGHKGYGGGGDDEEEEDED
jgi:hypothetical protein